MRILYLDIDTLVGGRSGTVWLSDAIRSEPSGQLRGDRAYPCYRCPRGCANTTLARSRLAPDSKRVTDKVT